MWNIIHRHRYIWFGVSEYSENKYFNLVSLGFYIENMSKWVSEGGFCPLKQHFPFKIIQKKRRRRKKTPPSYLLCYFQDTTTLKRTHPLHEIKPVDCPLQTRTHTHKKRQRLVRLCSVKEAVMLMEHNTGRRERLFGCEEVQRTWHVWWGAFLTRTLSW